MSTFIFGATNGKPTVTVKNDGAEQTPPPAAVTPDDATKSFFVKHSAEQRPRVLVVKASPDPIERLRAEPFVNDERTLLEKYVLVPLGLKREDVMLGWCDDAEELARFAKRERVEVISVSPMLRAPRWNFPDLWVAAENEERRAPEIARKSVALKKVLDDEAYFRRPSVSVADQGVQPTDPANHISLAKVRKELAKPSLQIVYGVVLDPYLVDAHNDWIPPADVEETAIRYMKDYRAISLHHEKPAPDAVLVESFVEPYPTANDRMRAHANESHKAYARMYGDDRIHSGAWIIGVQLSDELWKQYQRGEIGAFSIEGYGYRENLTQAAMPKVTFVELGEVGVTFGQEDSKARLA